MFQDVRRGLTRRRGGVVAALAVCALALASCGGGDSPAPGTVIGSGGSAGRPPAEGPPTTRARDPGDARLGAEARPQLIARYGGAVTGPLADYVTRLGRRIASESEQPEAAWTFTVLDTPVVNAFATPGGYVYVSRGLIALADDEAELAGVIGHEIGHVAADHAARRRRQSTLARLGALAAVIGASVLGAEGAMLDAVGQSAAAIGQGAVASFSREQELEADRLGVRYLARAGYDPEAQADFLESMQAQSALQSELAGRAYDANRVDFFATHPAAAARVREAIRAAAAEGLDMPGDRPRDRDRFLNAIDGMVYGDSRAQGFVREGRFLHPELRFAFAAPEGFTIANSARAVTMQGRSGRIVFDGGRDPGLAPARYIAEAWAPALAERAPTGRLSDLESFRIDGLEAAGAWMAVRTREGAALARLTAIRAGDGRLYRFFALVDPRDRSARAAARAAPRSFERLSMAETARLQPYRIRIVTVGRRDTVESLAARMPFERANLERFRVLNDLSPGERVAPGDRVKLVAG